MPCLSAALRSAWRLALCLALFPVSVAFAQLPTLEGQTLQGFHPTDTTGALTSTVGGGSFDVNAFLGAGRYYNHSTPITGQNTITTNLEAGHMWNGHESLAHVT
jgi:hypothetical protein